MSSPTVLFVLEKIMTGLENKEPAINIWCCLRPGLNHGNFYFICMIDLRQRSYQKELMDGDDIPFDAMAQTLKELNIVNTGWEVMRSH